MSKRTLVDWISTKLRTNRRKDGARKVTFPPLWRPLEQLEGRIAPAIRTWTGGGPDDLWSNAANWDVLPADGDDVRIAATAASAEVLFDASVLGGGISLHSLTSDGTNPVSEPFRITGAGLTLSGAGPFTIGAGLTIAGGTLSAGGAAADVVNAADLAFSGGSVTGAGTLNISGVFHWTGGTMQGSGTTHLANTGTFTLDGATGKTLQGRTLVNDSTATLSQGNLLLRDFAFFDNNGIFNATDDADLIESNNADSKFRNDGTFNKSGAGTLTSLNGLPFDNNGAVNVNSGTLQLTRGGTSTAGAFVVAGGAILEFANSYTLDAASTVSGAGAGQFTGGAVSVNGSYALTGATTVNGTVTFNTPTNLTTLNLSGGTLSGSGNVTIGTALNWSSGAMSGGGKTTVANTATFTMNTSAFPGKTLQNRTLANNTTATLSGDNLRMRDFAVFNNNGVFNATDDADLVETNNGDSSFHNNGTFTKSGAGTITSITSIAFTNSGTINVQAGRFALNSPFSNFSGTTLTGGVYNVSDTFQFAGANIVTNAATIVLDGAASRIVNQSDADALANFANNAATSNFTIQNGRNFTAVAPPSLLGSFSPGLGQLVGLALDPASGNLFVYPRNNANIFQFTFTGTLVGTIPRPGVASGNFDMDFTPEAVNIGGTIVPAGSLLAVNGDDAPNTLYALNKGTGAVLASVALSSPQGDHEQVGMTYHAGRHTVFVVDDISDQIREINPATGAQLNRFSVQPIGSPAFNEIFGDLEVDPVTGNLLVASSGQNIIRVLTPTGDFVGDVDVSLASVSANMAGLARNDQTGELYISTTSGTVLHVSPLGFRNAGSVTVGSGSQFILPSGINFTQTGGTSTVNGNLTDQAPPAGNALLFDGTNDTVEAPDSSSLDLTTEFTLEAWIFPTAIAGADRPVISKVGGPSGDNGYQFGVTHDSLLYVMFNAPGETWGANLLLSAPQNLLNKWSHIAATYDHSVERIYLDGALIASANVGAKSIIDSVSPLRIAGDSNNAVFFGGRIDEAREWNTAHSQDSILANMGHRLTGSEDGLVGYWTLDEGTGTTAFDHTANHNDGILGAGNA